MNTREFWIYLLLLAGSTYLIRAIPFALAQKKIDHPFVRSFLYYIPYAVLTAMTLPAIFYATRSIISAAMGLAVAIVFAYKEKSLTTVAIAACVAVFITELFI